VAVLILVGRRLWSDESKKMGRSLKANAPTESRKALLILGFVMGVGLLSALVYAAQSNAEQGFLAVASVAVLLAGASACVGGTLGFLFGIPRTLQQEGTGSSSDASARTANSAVAGRRIDYRVNTNLEQISDWLTKILVGVGLTQIPAIRNSVVSITVFAARGLGPQSQVFAFALLSYFAVLGFLFGYLWTRLFLAGALRAADQPAIEPPPAAVSPDKKRLKSKAERSPLAVSEEPIV
jgi:hypothetical protein